MRVLPRLNEDVNEEWISDKARFALDGLSRQRLDRPFVREGGKLEPATWAEAFSTIAARLKGVDGKRVAALAGDLSDCESMMALKDLMGELGSPNMDCRQDGAKLDPSNRSAYLFNSTIAGIDEAGACLLVGANPRLEAPVLNARLRKRYLEGGFPIGVIGSEADLTYACDHLGGGPDILDLLASGRHRFAKVLKSAARPMLILGQGALVRDDGLAVLDLARTLAETTGMVGDGWNGFNVLHTAAARVGGMDLRFLPGKGGFDTGEILDAAESGGMAVVYLLGADEIDMERLGQAFVIYQGHHGDAGAHRADVILPGAAYTEKTATYVNTEGRVQQGRRAVQPPGEAREDWRIIRALSEVLGKTLPFDSVDQVRRRMKDTNPCFAAAGVLEPANWGDFGAKGRIASDPFHSPVSNFYMTDPISRASVIMAECSHALAGADDRKTGTDG